MAEKVRSEKNKNLSQNPSSETSDKERMGGAGYRNGTTENENTETEEEGEYEGTDSKGKMVALDKEQEAEEIVSVSDFTCPICFKEFYSKFSRDRHVKLHKNLSETKKCLRRKIPSYPLKCSLCKMTFKYQFAVDFHVKENHTSNTAKEEAGSGGQKERKYALNCLFCKRSFKYKKSLNFHIKWKHSSSGSEENLLDLNLSQLKCPKCDIKFKHETNLKRHMKAHLNEEKTYSCPKCSKTFARHDNLTRHKLKEHKMTRINLDAIENSSNIDKQYICKMCGSEFGDDCLKLKNHLIHKACQKSNQDQLIDEQGRFKCTICGKSLSNAFNLSVHIKWKHSTPVRPFKCPHCDSTFKWDKSLKKHVERNHK